MDGQGINMMPYQKVCMLNVDIFLISYFFSIDVYKRHQNTAARGACSFFKTWSVLVSFFGILCWSLRVFETSPEYGAPGTPRNRRSV